MIYEACVTLQMKLLQNQCEPGLTRSNQMLTKWRGDEAFMQSHLQVIFQNNTSQSADNDKTKQGKWKN